MKSHQDDAANGPSSPRQELDRKGWKRLILYSSGLGLLGKLVSFGAFTMLAIVLVPDAFGQFSVVQMIITGAAAITSSSYAMAANSGVAHLVGSGMHLTYAQAISYSIHGLVKHITIASILTIALIPALYLLIMGGEFSSWIIGIGIASISLIISDICVGALAGLGAVRTSSLLDALRSLFRGSNALLFGILFGPVGAAWGLLIFDGALSIIAVTVALRINQSKDARSIQNVFRLQVRTIYAGVTSNSIAQIGNWTMLAAIQGTMGLAAVGLYAIAGRFAALVLLVPGFLSKNVLGELGRLLAANRLESFKTIVKKYVLGVLIVSIALSVAAFGVIVLSQDRLFPEYQNLALIVLILSIGAAIRASATANGVVLVSLQSRRTWIVSDLIATVASLVWIGISVYQEWSLEYLILSSILSAGVCLGIRILSTSRSIGAKRVILS